MGEGANDLGNICQLALPMVKAYFDVIRSYFLQSQNEYSPSGEAVAVYVRELQVGHVPDWLAPKVFHKLQQSGLSVTLGALIYIGHPN